MKRRTVLASIGVISVGTSGCLDRSGGGSPPTTTARPTDDSAGSTDETPGSTPGGFDGISCPSFTDSADRTVCFHTLGGASAPVFVEPSTETFEPAPGDGSVETIEFVLHNESGAGVGLNPHAWGIERRTSDGWDHVAPEVYPEPWMTVESGETYTWVLSVAARTQAMAERTMAITEDLAAGTYAFHVTCITGDESGDREQVECIALFDVHRQDGGA